MGLPERLREILQEKKLKQNAFADLLDMSPSYVSGLLSGRNRTMSSFLAERIENRLGYRAEWLLTGKEPKYHYHSNLTGLSPLHQRAIAQIEMMSEREVQAVLAFIESLEAVEKALK